MSKDLNKFCETIDSKKEEIAWAVAMAVTDGNEERAKHHLPYFLEAMNKTKSFIFKTVDSKNDYVLSIDKIFKDIEDVVGIENLKANFFGESKVSEVLYPNANLDFISKSDQVKLHKAYFSNSKTFAKLGIPYYTFINVFRDKGMEKAVELAKKVKYLEKKTSMYETKNGWARFKELFKFNLAKSSVGELIEEYNITSLDDLMNLYCEVCSFLIDPRDLSKEEISIIEENKKNFSYRTTDASIINDARRLESLKKKIEKVYSNKMMNVCLKQSNIKDFMEMYAIDLTKSNFETVISLYCYVYNVDGFYTRVKLDGEYTKVCFFNDYVFDQANSQQDLVIIHELIHSIEVVSKYQMEKPLNIKCKMMDEAFTQYFTYEAMKYMKSNILEENLIENDIKYSNSYDCMLPLVELLKKSTLWNDFVNCKLSNCYSLIEDRIGYSTARRISEIFTETYEARDEKDGLTIEYRYEELEKLIDKIEKTNRYYCKSR